MLIIIHSCSNLLQNSGFNFNCEGLVLALLDRIELGSILYHLFFQQNHLAIQVLFNILVVLNKASISFRANILHCPLVIDHHLLKMLFEFTIRLVKSYLYSLLQGGVINRHFVLQILQLLSESTFHCLELLSN